MEEIDILEFVRYYLSKIYIVIITFLIALIIGNLYSKNVKVPLYRSYTTVVLVSETDREYTQTDLTFNKNLVKTYSNIIKSKTILNKLIENLELDYSYQKLSGMITVSGIKDTEIIKIAVSSEDSNEAKMIADAIVPIFQDEVKRIYGIENVNVIDYAEESSKPYNMSIVKENIIYSLIGILIGSLIIFIIYYFDSSVKSVEMVEDKLGLTVLGIIPKIERRD